MNKNYVVFHLRECCDALESAIRDAKSKAYGEAELRVDIAHAYHHLNTAWNARHATPAQAESCEPADFEAWRQFPRDLEIV